MTLVDITPEGSHATVFLTDVAEAAFDGTPFDPEAEVAARQAQTVTAITKLTALGLTEDEAYALAGITPPTLEGAA